VSGRHDASIRRPIRASLIARFVGPLICASFGANLSPAADTPAATEMVTVIHLHTTLSDGAAVPVDLARAARAAGVDALVITDHYLEKVSYAPWPVGNVIGLSLSRPSVVSGGLDRYLETLSAAEREVPGVLLLPGLEVSPYARWTGSLLGRTLALEGWHRHLLVIGIEDPRELRDLPVVSNRRGGRYGPWSLLFLIPVTALVWSTARLARPGHRETRVGKFVLRRRRSPIVEGLVGAAALEVLVAGFPFRIDRWSAVGDDPGDAPFRCLEERVRSLGGLTSWAHPEATADTTEMGIRIVTPPYPDMVVRTDADAFGALPEGVRTLLPAGGLWDRALVDHLEGRRLGAPFAIAEIDEHRATQDIDLHILQTVCSVRERTHAGVVQALRTGTCYARWTPFNLPPLRLVTWEAAARSGTPVGAGGVLRQGGPLTVRMGVTGGDGHEVSARLLRRGEVIWSARIAPPFERAVSDDPQGPTYYRLDVEGAYPYRLIGNPIFVTATGGWSAGA
jgi:hypothetical protein